jgi:hypothetical protein
MYYQLLNTSVIWLLSLVVFDLFLKKETFHRLNRIYLLLTFVLGITLPLLPWRQQVTLSVTDRSTPPLATTAPAPANAISPAIPAAIQAPPNTVMHMDSSDWLRALYLAGMAVSIGLLLRDNLRLYLLYRRGEKTASGPWTIVETNQPHNPFSFRRCIFVCNRAKYTAQQWEMLVQHEQQHFHMQHMADLLLLQSARTLLWFHPLVYIYQRRLQLIHEYEVDSSTTYDLKEYGHFLLEQALLKPAPALTHTFNYKPLKNRIMMMTQKPSPRKMKLKLLLLLPLSACFTLCCSLSNNTLPLEVTKTEVFLKGNQVAYGNERTDSVWIENIETGERLLKITTLNAAPELLNNIHIEQPFSLKEEPKLIRSNGKSLAMDQLIDELDIQKLLSKLPDGKYIFGITYMVVNEKGKIVYFSDGGGPGIVGQDDKNGQQKFPALDAQQKPLMNMQDRNIIIKKLAALLMGPEVSYSIAQLPSGKIVPLSPYVGTFRSYFEVKSNHLTLR